MGELALSVLRPAAPDELIDEVAFEDDEFLPYWAELWPAASALAGALPLRLDGARVVELGCGLALPSLVAASRGADVTAIDWAKDAIELLRQNAERNDLHIHAEVRDWREPWIEEFDFVLAADVLYERRNVEPLLARMRELAPVALLGLANRPYEAEFLSAFGGKVEELAQRVVRLTRPRVTGLPSNLRGRVASNGSPLELGLTNALVLGGRLGWDGCA